MKLGQVIEYIKRHDFLKNYAENKAGRLVPDHDFDSLQRDIQ